MANENNKMQFWIDKYQKEGVSLEGVSINVETGELSMMDSLLPDENFVYSGEREVLEQAIRDNPKLKGLFGF